jgi:hypothetical protein
MRYLRFTNWLTEIDRLSGPIGAIWFEEVRRHAGTDAAHVYGGLMATGNFNIQGILAFNALMRFEPFSFEIDIRATVRVRYKSRSLAGLTLTGSLIGPGPVVLRAKVCIELLFFDICFSDTFTLGSSVPRPQTTIVSALDVLLAELERPSSLRVSGSTDRFVTLRAAVAGADRPVLSPVGQLVLAQRQAPLGLLLQRIGGAPLGSPQVVEASSPDATTPELEWFAPGAFADLTDDQALTRRGFERLSGGLRFGTTGVRSGPAMQREVTIQQILLPAKTPSRRMPTTFHDWVSMAATRAVGRQRNDSPVTPAITVTEEHWTITDITTGESTTGLLAAHARQLAALAPSAKGRVASPAVDRLSALVL